LAALLRETADGLGRLIADHVRLAKLELLVDARSLGRQASLLIVALPLCLVGYLFLCLAGIFALAPLLGRVAAFLLVGGAHIVFGGGALWVAVRRLRRRPKLMDDTVAEVTRTFEVMSSLNGAANGATSAGAALSSSGHREGGASAARSEELTAASVRAPPPSSGSF
jgi:hypothetical protein